MTHSRCTHGRRGGVSRRRFVGTLGASSIGLALGWPGALSAFPVQTPRARVAVATATTYERAAVRNVMAALFDTLGGLDDIIRPGDRVGIKINLTGGLWNANSYERRVGMPPGETFWTHPEVLRAVGELVRDAGAGTVYVLEANGDAWGGYADYGYVAATNDFGGTFVNLNTTAPWQSFATRPVGQDAFIYESFRQNFVLNELDCVVSLAKSKQHAEAGVTHGMKNHVGSVPLALYNGGDAGSRQEFHRHTSYDGDRHSNLCRVVLDLNGATPIQLVVNDAVKTVLGGEGPWHNLTTANFNTFVASKDPVAADVVATQAMGLDPAAGIGSATFPDSLNYLHLAAELGKGVADLAQIEVVQASPAGAEREDPDASELLLQAYPNPFDTALALELVARTSRYTEIAIFDVRGGLVIRLLSRVLPAGRHTIEWHGNAANGRRVPPGVYLVRVQSGPQNRTLKVARVL